MTEPHEPSMRASDHDREAVAERLRAALDEGRLDLAEYDDRLRRAYAAIVQSDLVPLTSDLPEPAPEQSPAAVARPDRAKAKRVREWRDWASTSFVLVGIWAVISFASGEPHFFWPIFPMGIWGVILVAGLIFGDGDGESETEDGKDGAR